MPPSRVFSFDQSLELLKHSWSSESAFSLLAKSISIDDALAKFREKWTTFPLLCQRQLMVMLSSELEADCSISSRIGELASQALLPENDDDWLRYLASFLTRTLTMAPSDLLHQPMFFERPRLPERTLLLPDDELVVCISAVQGGGASAQVGAGAPTASKTAPSVLKPLRPPTAAHAVAVSSRAAVEVYKPKNFAELLDFDPIEPDLKKGPQKKRRCR